MEEKNVYFKQEKLLNASDKDIVNKKIIVYGAGSIGSHVVVGLSKMGFKNIQVIDFDTIEESNIPAQFYPSNFMEEQGYGKLKYDVTAPSKIVALRDMVYIMSGTELQTDGNIVKIDEKSNLDVELGSIHIIAFDNIEGRKIIFEKLKDYPVHFIDGRIGGFNMEKYYLSMTDQEGIDEYAKTLEGSFSELECGEKCLWAVNSMISAKILADVIKIVKGQIPNFMFKNNLMGDIEIKKEKGGK